MLVRLLSNVGHGEPPLPLLLTGSLGIGVALALVAVLPFWALRRRLSAAWALVLVLAVMGTTLEVIRPLMQARGRWEIARMLRELMLAGGIGLLIAALALTVEARRQTQGLRQPRPPQHTRRATHPGIVDEKTRAQRAVVCLAVGVIVLMLLVPPWIRTFSYPGMRSEAPVGYAPIFAPPRADNLAMGVRLDVARLLVQVAIVGLVAGAFYWWAQAGPGPGKGAAPPPGSPGRPSSAGATSSVPDVSPSMASLFASDGELVPEARPFADRGDLLKVEGDSLLPVWWPEIHEGVHWTPEQRLRAFEDALRASMRPGANPEALEILTALRLLRSALPPEPTFAQD